MAAGFNAPISGVFFAVESVLQRPGMVKDEAGSPMSADSSGASFSSALTVAMVLLASVVAAVVSQVFSLGSSLEASLAASLAAVGSCQVLLLEAVPRFWTDQDPNLGFDAFCLLGAD